MEDEDQYHEKINLSHPTAGIEVAEEDKRAHKIEQTKLAIEAAIKEWQEDKEILQQAEGRLQEDPQTYSEILTNRFGAEFTKRFYGFSTISKDVLNKHPLEPTPAVIPAVHHDVLTNAMTAFTNMHMAHEICINTEYRLKTPVKVDTIDARVSAMMRKAFWDLVDEDLDKEPPIYDHALAVFEEIREKLLSLLLPNNGAIRLRIEDTLDLKEIRKQLAHEALDFERYIHFIVDCLAKLCSPSRDADVEAIRNLEKPSEIFSHLFDVMDAMQLDMANFLISVYRPKIMEHCITYERKKFMEFMELEYDLNQDGLRSTREWLFRHKIDKRNTSTTIAKAFGEILNWDYKNPWPETLALDTLRLGNIARLIKRATMFGGMTLSVIELCKPLFVRNYYVIYNTVRLDLDAAFKTLLSLDDMKEKQKVVVDTEACAEEAVRVVSKHLLSFEGKELPEEDANLVRSAVKDIVRPDNKVRSLLMLRIQQYVEEIIFSESKYKVPLTPGLSSIRLEVELCTLEFSRIVLHNRNVYNDIYCDIVDGTAPLLNFDENNRDVNYAHFLLKLKMTHRSSHSMAKQLLPGQTETKFDPHHIVSVREASPQVTNIHPLRKSVLPTPSGVAKTEPIATTSKNLNPGVAPSTTSVMQMPFDPKTYSVSKVYPPSNEVPKVIPARGDVCVRHSSRKHNGAHSCPSTLSNFPGTLPDSWTPSASHYGSFRTLGSAAGSSVSNISNPQSQSETDDAADDDRVTGQSRNTIFAIPSTAILLADTLQHVPETKVNEEEVQTVATHGTTTAYDSPEDSIVDLAPKWLAADRFSSKPVYRYSPQVLLDRPNPFLLTKRVPSDFRFTHPILNEVVIELEEGVKSCANLKKCETPPKIDSWLDVDDIEGVNWTNHWILRNDQIYKHWLHPKKDRKDSTFEVFEEEVEEDQPKAGELEEEAKLRIAKMKVFDFRDEQEREAMISQKLDMERVVDKSKLPKSSGKGAKK